MPGIYRLKPNEFREWRTNAPLLVDGAGTIIRDATEKEAASPTKTVMINDIDPDTGKRIGECAIVYARDRLMSDILEKHGEVLVKAPNNRNLKKLRDPSLAKYKNRTGGPAPEMCNCREWADREEGRHHYMCQANTTAPEEERSTRWLQEHRGRAYTGTALQREVPRRTDVSKRQEELAVKIVAPAECACREYDYDKQGVEHHPVCANRAAWEKHQKEGGQPPAEPLATATTSEPAPSETTSAGSEPALNGLSPLESARIPHSETGYYLFYHNGQLARAADPDEVESCDFLGRLSLEGHDFIVCTIDGQPVTRAVITQPAESSEVAPEAASEATPPEATSPEVAQ